MNWNEIKAEWKDVRGRIKERWSDLTGDDLDRIAGARDRLIAAIERRYNIERKKAAEQVAEWEESLLASIRGR